MAIVFRVPAPLQRFTGGASRVEIAASPATVSDALGALWALHPGVRDRVVDERGQVRPHVNVFVGSEAIRFTGGLATPVPEGSTIAIVPAVSGGAPSDTASDTPPSTLSTTSSTTPPGVADFRAAGLYDPSAPGAADRLALLEWLAGQDIGVDDMVRAQREGSITGLAADLLLRGRDRLRLADIARRLGTTPEQIEEMRLAVGLPPVDPDEPAFTASDVGSLRIFLAGASLFGKPFAFQFARIVGSALSRIAEACVSLFLVNVEAPIRQTHAGELALAQANLRAMQALETVPAAIQPILRAHLDTAIRRSRRSRTDGLAAVSKLAVGFVDLVGFTPLSRERPPHELAALVEHFEHLANEITTSRDGRVVKLIGDAVMFVAVDPEAACDIAVTLAERFVEDEGVAPRGGLASGEVLMRGGDYYGPVVNLAARIADQAVPNEILVTSEVVEGAAGDRFRFEPAGKRMLKGFTEPVRLYTACRL